MFSNPARFFLSQSNAMVGPSRRPCSSCERCRWANGQFSYVGLIGCGDFGLLGLVVGKKKTCDLLTENRTSSRVERGAFGTVIRAAGLIPYSVVVAATAEVNATWIIVCALPGLVFQGRSESLTSCF